MIARLLRWLTASVVISGAMMAIAGRTDLPHLLGVVALLVAFLLAGLLCIPAETTRGRFSKQQTADPAVLATVRLMSLATLVLGPLDVGRLHWADTVPEALSYGALAAAAAALGFALLAVRTNRFFMPAVRIQEERGHRVVDSGPYRLVRHPGYLAMLVFLPSAALAMGSWLALAPGLAGGLAFAWRARGEDRFLQANLEGYAAYAVRTPWRLIPGVW